MKIYKSYELRIFIDIFPTSNFVNNRIIYSYYNLKVLNYYHLVREKILYIEIIS